MLPDLLAYPVGSEHPGKCPKCGGALVLIDGERLFYGCKNYPDCDGSAASHPNGLPVGLPADDETKVLRTACHVLFEQTQKATGLSRSELYEKINDEVGIMHFSMMDESYLRSAVIFMNRLMRGKVK